MSCPACHKGDRAVLYCRRLESDCPRRNPLIAVDLPRPDVAVSTRTRDDGGTDLDVVISRDGKARSYSSNRTGVPDTAPIKEIVEKILSDSATGEWLPAGKRY